MQVFNDSRLLIEALKAHLEEPIAIDGWHGSGKSWFARALSVCTKRPRFDLDAALARSMDAFVEHLDLDQIKAALAASPSLILSGVCMREVLRRIGLSAVTNVYVKRMHHGYWTHEDEAVGGDGDYRLIDATAPPGALELEVREYHARWKPHQTADYILQRATSRRTGL